MASGELTANLVFDKSTKHHEGQPVSALAAEPTPGETLKALRSEAQSRMEEAKVLSAQGLLKPVELANLTGLDAKVGSDYKNEFAWDANKQAERAVDPKTGSTILEFKSSEGKLQELDFSDKDGSKHQYLFNNTGDIVEGKSFDSKGNGVALDHVKWTVNAVTRVNQGKRTEQNYDGNERIS